LNGNACTGKAGSSTHALPIDPDDPEERVPSLNQIAGKVRVTKGGGQKVRSGFDHSHDWIVIVSTGDDHQQLIEGHLLFKPDKRNRLIAPVLPDRHSVFFIAVNFCILLIVAPGPELYLT
jgi:hypothetical protein